MKIQVKRNIFVLKIVKSRLSLGSYNKLKFRLRGFGALSVKASRLSLIDFRIPDEAVESELVSHG
jgi:hypothetical protein